VSELLRQFEDASIAAQYGEYHYKPPPMMHGKYEGGEFTIVLGRGQRIDGVVDEPPAYLGWMVTLFGEHCFTDVTEIQICDDRRFTDADVRLLLAFPELKVLDLSETAITDVGLTRLASLEGLVGLDVSGTNVSQKSLRRLSRCSKLRELDIRDTKADNRVAVYLKDSLPECWIRSDFETLEE
jgi:hypothetical protein